MIGFLRMFISFFKENYLMSEKSSNFAPQSEVMSEFAALNIDLKALDEGETRLEQDLDDGFFEAVDAPDVHRGRLHTTLTIYRTGDFFELTFKTEGSVVVQCDDCLDDMDQPIDTENRLAVKLGDAYLEDDDLVTVDERVGRIDVSWFVYESIALNIPIRHVHAPGKCNAAMMKVLEEHSASRRGEAELEAPVDPRWAALMKLKE